MAQVNNGKKTDKGRDLPGARGLETSVGVSAAPFLPFLHSRESENDNDGRNESDGGSEGRSERGLVGGDRGEDVSSGNSNDDDHDGGDSENDEYGNESDDGSEGSSESGHAEGERGEDAGSGNAIDGDHDVGDGGDSENDEYGNESDDGSEGRSESGHAEGDGGEDAGSGNSNVDASGADVDVEDDGDSVSGNLTSVQKFDMRKKVNKIVSKALRGLSNPTDLPPPSSTSTTTSVPNVRAPTGGLFYAPAALGEEDLKTHGLTQLEISIEGNSLELRRPRNNKSKSGPSKRGPSSSLDTENAQKTLTKKTRRTENAKGVEIQPKLNLENKTAHVDIKLPDEVEILSLVIYTSSGIKNSILLPLSSAPFRKLVDQTTPPKRKKTREDWNKIKSKWFC